MSMRGGSVPGFLCSCLGFCGFFLPCVSCFLFGYLFLGLFGGRGSGDMHTPNTAEGGLYLDGQRRQAVKLLPGAMLTTDIT